MASRIDEINVDTEALGAGALSDALWKPVLDKYERKEALVPTEILRRIERDIMLQIVDAQWKDHLYSLDHLKEGIGLRGYGQRDPLVEYKKEELCPVPGDEESHRRGIVRSCGGHAGAPPATIPKLVAEVRQPPPRRAPQVTLSAQQPPPPSPFGAIGSGNAAAPPEAPRPARTGGDDVIKQVKREERRSGATIRVPAAAAGSTRNVMARRQRVIGRASGNEQEGQRAVPFAALRTPWKHVRMF